MLGSNGNSTGRGAKRPDPRLRATSEPDVFAAPDGRLFHRKLGHLPVKVASLPPLGGGRRLAVAAGDAVPADKLDRLVPEGAIVGRPMTVLNGQSGIYDQIGGLIDKAGKYLGYVSTVKSAIEFIKGLDGLLDEESDPLAEIQAKLDAILSAVAATDYLQKSQQLAGMRGTASVVAKNLRVATNPKATHKERANADDQITQGSGILLGHIDALLAEDLPYFKRVYNEASISDGWWLSILPDRPVQADGTCFEYRLALPTLVRLIGVELAVFKYQNPDFVDDQTQTPFIEHWWRRLLALTGIILDRTIRSVRPPEIEIQCVRTQQQLHEFIGSYSNWHLHVPASPPWAVAPLGAVDITTGLNNINWDYEQFNEFYLRDRLRPKGINAGPNPPCMGKAYSPPPWLIDYKPVEQEAERYFSIADWRLQQARSELWRGMGVSEVGNFAWSLWFFMTRDPLPITA